MMSLMLLLFFFFCTEHLLLAIGTISYLHLIIEPEKIFLFGLSYLMTNGTIAIFMMSFVLFVISIYTRFNDINNCIKYESLNVLDYLIKFTFFLISENIFQQQKKNLKSLAWNVYLIPKFKGKLS